MSIKQPSDKVFKNTKLVWNRSFKSKYQGRFDKVQEYIDSTCIKLMRKYTPFKSGILEKSATLGTKIGSGKIIQTAPYARYQYYGRLMVSSKTGSAWSKGESKVLTDKKLNYDTSKHPLAGSYWFERMKAAHKKDILKGAGKIAGGKV